MKLVLTRPPTGNTFTKIAWTVSLTWSQLPLRSTTTFTVITPPLLPPIPPLIGPRTTATWSENPTTRNLLSLCDSTLPSTRKIFSIFIHVFYQISSDICIGGQKITIRCKKKFSETTREVMCLPTLPTWLALPFLTPTSPLELLWTVLPDLSMVSLTRKSLFGSPR